MTERNRDYLKQEFKDGERPSGLDFADLIDSFVNKTNDGLSFDAESNVQLSRGVRLGDSAATAAGTLRFHGGAVQFHDGTTWQNVGTGSGGAFQPIGGGPAVGYAGGNVGIGALLDTGGNPKPVPTYRLEVELGANTAGAESERVRFGNAVCSNGSAAFQGYAYFAHQSHSSNSNYALRQGPNGNVHINAPTNQPISIRHNGNQIRMGVSAAGNVIVGGDGDLVDAGSAKLQVSGGAFKNEGGNLWSVPSDARLKDDIRDLEIGLQQLVQVRPVRFRYNGKAGTAHGAEGVGVVAQELERVFPEMVTRVKNPSPGDLDDAELLIYNGSALTYVLVNAVKELATKVQRLEAALAARVDGHAEASNVP